MRCLLDTTKATRLGKPSIKKTVPIGKKKIGKNHPALYQDSQHGFIAASTIVDNATQYLQIVLGRFISRQKA